MAVIATAGHVDHGKSTLVRALTGTDPDRLAEERARGLTIDLGFAAMTLDDGQTLAIVDVPGHVRFLSNMLAGVGGVDACLFVVDANEGFKPQSEEHLRILELLGHRHGVVALTKIDTVDDELAELARLDLDDHLDGSFLSDAPVVEVDAVSGRGMQQLRVALGELVTAAPTPLDRDRPRLWVDRSFTATGAGTVVTGTLTGGGIGVDDELVVAPTLRPVRVRGVQSHGDAVLGRLGPGHRAALNLSGVARTEVGRGDVVVRPGQWWSTRTFDAELHVLGSLDHEVSRRGAYHLHLGTADLAAALRVLGPESLSPGETGTVRIHLPVAVPMAPGDRYLLRESGRDETVGGGEVLDVDPVVPATRARPDRDVARVVRERGVVDVEVLARLTGVPTAADVGRWVVDPEVLAERRGRLRSSIDRCGPLGLDLAAVDELDRALADGLDGVTVADGRARVADTVDPLDGHPFVAALADRPFDPPSAADDGVDRAELRELVRRGDVVESDGHHFATSAVAAAARRLDDALVAAPDGLTVAEVRDLLGTSRKHVLPLLAHLDRVGATRRRGDRRIAGPRLAATAGDTT